MVAKSQKGKNSQTEREVRIAIPKNIQGARAQRAWVKKALGFLTVLDASLAHEEAQEAQSQSIAQGFSDLTYPGKPLYLNQ